MNRFIIERAGAPVGWFDVRSVDRIFEAEKVDSYRSVRLYRLRSGAWIREEAQPNGPGFVQVDERTAALWLILHGFLTEADRFLPEAVASTRF